MFCPKCGARVSDDAGFCQKCGTKLNPGNTAQSAVDDSSNPVKQDAGTSRSASKKKKLPIILGVAVGMILLLVVLASIGGSEEPDEQPQQPSEGANTDVDFPETPINTDVDLYETSSKFLNYLFIGWQMAISLGIQGFFAICHIGRNFA